MVLFYSDINYQEINRDKLSLLVGTKDVGDSVRRLMERMFMDDILTEYSLQGKKKKNFSELPVYQLLIGETSNLIFINSTCII